MKLHVRLLAAQQQRDLPAVVLLHGLFGSLDNLGVLARNLVSDYPVLQVDMPNHGLSPRTDDMSYGAQAAALLDTLDACQLNQVILIGHSMGGKAAMALCALAPQRVAKLVVIDISPVDYQLRRHDDIFTALEAVSAAGISNRTQAAALMQQYLSEPAVIPFLLKSFTDGQWRFNVPVLKAQYQQIIGWQSIAALPHPALVLRGEQSSYVAEAWQPPLFAQFPHAQLVTIANASHWLHAQQPQAVIGHIRTFLAGTNGLKNTAE